MCVFIGMTIRHKPVTGELRARLLYGADIFATNTNQDGQKQEAQG